MQFRLTESGQLLRSDRPDSMHAFVRMFGDPTMLASWRELDTAIQTGETPFERIFGTRFFDYLSANPQISEQFNAAMRQGTTVAVRQLLRHYDFGPFHTIADFGGGDGTLLAAVLQVTRQQRKTVAWVTGHGEGDPASNDRNRAIEAGYDCRR